MTVYAIKRQGSDGPIKIGYARSFSSRLKTLSTATPDEGFDVLALIDAGRGVERALHVDRRQVVTG